MINKSVLLQSGIDYDAELRRFMDDELLFESVLRAFTRETVLERAREAYKSRSLAELRTAVLEACGSSSNAGLREVYIEASTLISLLKGESFTQDELSEEFTRFESAYLAAENAVKAALC